MSVQRARAQGHCPGPQRGGAGLRRRRAVRRGEPVAVTAEGQRALRPGGFRRRRAGSTSSTTCAAAGSSSPTPAATPTTAAMSPGRQLANVYAQTLGTIFTEQAKPYEVELCVAEVAHYGETKPPELYRITYDGSIADEPHFVVMGGTTEPIITALKESYAENAELRRRGARSPSTRCGRNRSARQRPPPASSGCSVLASLEVAILDANRPRRAFRRITGAALESLLPKDLPESAAAAEGDSARLVRRSATPGCRRRAPDLTACRRTAGTGPPAGVPAGCARWAAVRGEPAECHGHDATENQDVHCRPFRGRLLLIHSRRLVRSVGGVRNHAVSSITCAEAHRPGCGRGRR